jgi:tRNA(fMet)-specific endonuclease VapC
MYCLTRRPTRHCGEDTNLFSTCCGDRGAGYRWAENKAQLAQILSKPSVRVLNVTEETALRYAEVDVYLRKKGRPIPRNDVWIAAVALEHGLQLLTLDVHFREIPLILIQP